MFPTYPLVIPKIYRCTYSPQPSVQIYLGYGHCTPISAGAPMVLFVIDAKKDK